MTIIFSTNDTFIRRLSDLLTTENISHRKLCEKVNIQRKSLYSWLQGRYFPQYDSLIRLADFFKVSINYLLGISEDNYSPNHCSIKEVPTHFRTVILKYMEEKSLTKYSFSKKIGTGQSTLKRWIECNSVPDTSVLIKISRVTGFSVDYLLGYE